MYLNDLQRSDFYSTIGLDARQFDKHVIRKTNQSSATLFPVVLDVDNPKFFELLESCAGSNQELIDLEKSKNDGLLNTFKKVPCYINIAFTLLQMFLMPSVDSKVI
jgi:magnesium-protoporphyrin IX monomethyl ester (oxidative) cyclase